MYKLSIHKKLYILFFLVALASFEINLYDNFYTLLTLTSLLVLGVASIVTSHKLPHHGAYSLVLVFIFFLYHVLISLAHGDFDSALRFLLFPLVYYLALINLQRIDDFLRLVPLVALPFALLSMLIQAGLIDWWSLVHLRNASIFFDPNYAGAIFALSALVTIIYRRSLALPYLLLAIFVVALYLTFSRGSIIAFAAGGFVYAIFYAQARVAIMLAAIFTTIFLYLTWYLFVDQIDLLLRVEQGLNSRDEFWLAVSNLVFIEKNYFGVGVDGLKDYFSSIGFTVSSSHSYMFDMLGAFGIPSVFLLLLILSLAFFKALLVKNKLLPIFILITVNSFAIAISFGGINFLSYIYTLIIAASLAQNNEGLKWRMKIGSGVRIQDDDKVRNIEICSAN